MTVKELIVALLEMSKNVEEEQVQFSFSTPDGETVINAKENFLIREGTGKVVLIENL